MKTRVVKDYVLLVRGQSPRNWQDQGTDSTLTTSWTIAERVQLSAREANAARKTNA